MAEWQPIETAPRDGTDILLYRKRLPMVVAGWFDNGEEAGWSSYEAPDEWISQKHNPFTHWQHLPTPPETDND